MTDEFKFDTSQITTLDERFGKCPYATAQSLISGKWAPPILLYLSDGPIRFNELQRRMPKMTHATLSVQLKSLVENGLVERTQQSVDKVYTLLFLSILLYEVIKMLTIRENNFRNEEQYITIDSLVPKNHLVRKIENAINFEFIYDEVKDLYSPLGAPSIDPVVLIKIVLIQYLFGIPSMRQTIKDIEVNVAYRWFLGYSLTEKIPHFSTFNKNYERRFKDTDLFEVIFKKILAQATLNGFIDSSNIFIDSTHIKASANKKKYNKIEIDMQAKKYQDLLNKEINEDRLKHGKKPLAKPYLSVKKNKK